MASIFSVVYNLLVQQLTPPLERQPRHVAWLSALSAPLDINNQLFNEYLSGSTAYSVFSPISAYTIGTRVIYSDDLIYENLTGSTAGILPTDTNNWLVVNPNYVGAIERSNMSARKLIFELALNRHFQVNGFVPTIMLPVVQSTFTASANTIYIQNNQVFNSGFLMGQTGAYSSFMSNNSIYSQSYMGNIYSGISNNDYTIFVPNYIYTGISESIVRNFADGINMAGMQYSVQSY